MRWAVMRLLTLALASSAACSESTQPTQPGPGNPPLVTFAGVISESGTNTPLAAVSVCFPYWNCMLTSADGSYYFTVDRGTVGVSNPNPCPFAFRDGYEQRGACVPLTNNRVSWSTTLQRTITLDAGRSVRSTVFTGEGSGVVDSGLCEPCKSFNVLVPGSGTLFLHAVADSPESKLRVQVFYEGFENGALQITTQRIVQVVVHAVVVPASFELVTSFQPGS